MRGGVFDRLAGRDAGSVKAVDGVSFTLKAGEVLGVVGESGSGKTTLGRAIVGMAPVTGGTMRFEGDDLVSLRGNERRAARRRLQMVFQDPHASLNPSMDMLTADRRTRCASTASPRTRPRSSAASARPSSGSASARSSASSTSSPPTSPAARSSAR